MTSLKGKNIVFTGFRDAELEGKIKAKGGEVMTSVSKRTDIVVKEGAKGELSSKVKKAQELGLVIMEKAEFEKKYFKKTLLDKLLGKSAEAKQKAYYIHDNGGRPFKVVVTNTQFWVYKDTTNYDDWDEKGYQYDKLLIKPTKYADIHIGKDTKLGKKFDGNSILVQLIQPKTYMYIGQEIYKFKTKDIILRYKSPVGNSDVPYPYAIGSENTYLMIEYTYIPNDMLVEKDPYVQLYGFNLGLSTKKQQELERQHKKKYKLAYTLIQKRL